MTAADLPLCRHLVRQAGWNQVDADWMRAIELEPMGCFVAELDHLPVATTTTCRFETIAWIAMVLVDKTVRGQGIGKQMVEHAIEYLDRRQVETIRLDATSLGEPLYRKLGFHADYEVVRYCKIPVSEKYDLENILPISVEDRVTPELISLDQRITGTNRKFFITDLVRESGSPFYYKVNEADNLVGYTGSRKGNTAIQIGPAMAFSPNVGRQLMDTITSDFSEVRAYIDIPVENKSATKWAKTNGFKEQRRFMRMSRGKKVLDLPELIWASSGPEKG